MIKCSIIKCEKLFTPKHPKHTRCDDCQNKKLKKAWARRDKKLRESTNGLPDGAWYFK